VVWCPKYRKDLFSDTRLRQYCGELLKNIAARYECEIETHEVAVDHVHLLITVPPKLSVADAVRVIKSISAREIFERFPGVRERLSRGKLWGDGYYVKSVGADINSERVKKYIESHESRSVSTWACR